MALAVISGTEVYSELCIPHTKWSLVLAALLFGAWFGYLGVTGRRPNEVIKKLKPWAISNLPKRRQKTAWDLAQERLKQPRR